MSSIETIASFARRRGFVWQGSGLYGGLAGTWDYGPLGALLKENIKQEWLKKFLRGMGVGIYRVDAALIGSSGIFEASGHLKEFTDPLVDCKKCRQRFREDEFDGGGCPECGGELTEIRNFNLMFKTHAGPVEDESSVAYLRPETAQGIFTNFKNVVDSFHPKLPFGIAQIGKAFRNEITPRNFLFRAREFEQMELELFCNPKEADKIFEDIKKMRMQWFLDLGIKKENLRFHDYAPDELSHYSSATTDIEYKFGISKDGFSELEGVANRTDFDLKSHYPDSVWVGDEFREQKEKDKGGFVPFVIEPSAGLDRAFLAFLMDAYAEDEISGEKRAVLKIHPRLAPYKVAVFPLLRNKEQLVKKARSVYENLASGTDYTVVWDDNGNVGKRYRRQDEIGTPWCITVDFQTLEDDTVTIRDRDTAKQERISVGDIAAYIAKHLVL